MLLKRLLIVLIIVFTSLLGACGPSLMEIRDNYVRAHPNLDPKIREAILKGDIVAGMTREEVRASLGEPYNVTSRFEAERYGRYGRYSGQCHYWRYKYSTIIFGEDGKVIDMK